MASLGHTGLMPVNKNDQWENPPKYENGLDAWHQMFGHLSISTEHMYVLDMPAAHFSMNKPRNATRQNRIAKTNYAILGGFTKFPLLFPRNKPSMGRYKLPINPKSQTLAMSWQGVIFYKAKRVDSFCFYLLFA